MSLAVEQSTRGNHEVPNEAAVGVQDPVQPVRAVAHHHLRHPAASAQRRLMDLRAAQVRCHNLHQHP
jgi:hypothetical protein